jgi:hypothetical protein
MTSAQIPPAQHRTGPFADRQWLLLGAACVAAVLLLAAIATVVLRLGRADAHSVTAPLDDRRDARLVMASGADAMTVGMANLGDRLYRISTPTGKAPVPHVIKKGNLVQLKLTGGGGSSVDIRLSSRVRWGLRIAVGLGQTKINLMGGSVSFVDFAAGVGIADVSLPMPTGTVPVRIGAGGNMITVHLRPGVAAAVRVRSGVGNLTLDGKPQSAVHSGAVYPLAGYANARNRYEIDLATGVASLTVRRD